MASEENDSNNFRPFTSESFINRRTQQRETDKNKTKHNVPDPMLQNGSTLPYNFWKNLSPSHISTPLEDIDPFYNSQKTFIIINSKKTIFRFNATKSLWLFDPFNTVRLAAIYILVHWLFTFFISVTLIVNSFAWMSPASSKTWIIEIICTGIYTFEAAVKIISKGFVMEPHTYLRNSWNRVEFIVLLASLISIVTNTGIQSLVVFRLIQILTFSSKYKIIVEATSRSIKNLRDVMIVLIASIWVFALIGMQLYKGVLTQKCIKTFPMDENLTDENWANFVRNESNWYVDEATNEYELCGNSSGARQCVSGYVCLQGYGSNLHYGYTNFDTFGWSCLSVLNLIAQDFWEEVYHSILATSGTYHTLFFVCAICLGSFNLMYLILATVVMTYEDVKAKADEEVRLLERLQEVAVDVGSRNNEIGEKSLWDQMLSYLDKVTDLLCVWNCGRYWQSMQKIIDVIIFHPFAELFFMLCIIVSTIFSALYHHNMTIDLYRILSTGNDIFAITFTIEIILKIVAKSPKIYFKSYWNIIDFIAVSLSIFLHIFGIESVFLMLRVLKLFSVLQLVKSWTKLNLLINVFFNSFASIVNVASVMFVVIFIFAILGMEHFSENYLVNIHRFPDSTLPRWNFVDFFHSFMTVFRALCGEWIESLWDCMLIGDITCVPFFLSFVFIGHFVILNLFLAVIIYSFRTCKLSPSKVIQDATRLIEIVDKISTLCKCGKDTSIEVLEEPKNNKRENIKYLVLKEDSRLEDNRPSPSIDPGASDNFFEIDVTSENRAPEDARRGHNVWSELQDKTFILINNKYFEVAMNAVIVLNCILLTMENDQTLQGSTLGHVIFSLDKLFTAIFFIEILIKLPALGFMRYFTDIWCLLDFIIVTTSIINLMVAFCDPGSLLLCRPFKALWILRLLRSLLIIEDIRKTFNIVIASIPYILNAMMVCFLVWLLFAVLGVYLFAGEFFKCDMADDNVRLLHECLYKNYTWINSEMNFDHVGNSFLSLTQIATFKGWIGIMNDAVDSAGVHRQSIRETNINNYLYFVVFILFGPFYTINLIVGAIISNYNDKANKLKEIEMSADEKYRKLYEAAVQKIRSLELVKDIPKPKWKPQVKIFEIVTSRKFDAMMLLIIFLNFLTMTLDGYNQSAYSIHTIDSINLGFIVVFSTLSLIKLLAQPYFYFKQFWNWFEIVVVTLSLLEFSLNTKFLMSPPILRVAYVSEIRRLLHSVKTMKGLRIIFSTLSKSLPSLFYICLLLFSAMYIYAILGMSFFSHLDDKNYHFKTFGQSMIVLFQMLTTAGWDGLLHVITYKDIESGYSEMRGIAYLLSFLIISFAILKTYIAVIINNYSQAREDEENITDDDICRFYETWKKFDPGATQYIPYDQFTKFLAMLEAPLKIDNVNKFKLASMDIPICRGDLLFCVDVLDALIREFFHRKYGVTNIEPIPNRSTYETVSSTLRRQREEHCAKLIQDVWHKYKQRRSTDNI